MIASAWRQGFEWSGGGLSQHVGGRAVSDAGGGESRGGRARVREMVTHALRLSRLASNCKGLEPPAAGRLAEVHAPTLVVLGDKDTPDIHAIGRLIHEGVAGSRLAWIRDAGHTLVMEKSDEFNRVVLRVSASLRWLGWPG